MCCASAQNLIAGQIVFALMSLCSQPHTHKQHTAHIGWVNVFMRTKWHNQCDIVKNTIQWICRSIVIAVVAVAVAFAFAWVVLLIALYMHQAKIDELMNIKCLSS